MFQIEEMVLATIARFIAPPRCLGCSQEGEVVCAKCIKVKIMAPEPICIRCNKNNAEKRICDRCRPKCALDSVVVGANFDGLAHDLIERLKYRRLREAARPLASLITLQRPIDFDCVTSVPVATSRLRARGYNQAELIARCLAKNHSLPYRRLLYRRRNTQQVGKTRAQRQVEVEGAFIASRRALSLKILLVDDVLTTGATLNSCAAALKDAGADEVFGCVAARET